MAFKFALLACNSFRQQAPEMLHYQWIVANSAQQRVVSLPDFSLPAAAELPGIFDKDSPLLKLHQHSSQLFFSPIGLGGFGGFFQRRL